MQFSTVFYPEFYVLAVDTLSRKVGEYGKKDGTAINWKNLQLAVMGVAGHKDIKTIFLDWCWGVFGNIFFPG